MPPAKKAPAKKAPAKKAPAPRADEPVDPGPIPEPEPAPPPPPPPAPDLPPMPLVKQCVDPESHQYGAVAVDAGNGVWGVMNPGVLNANARGGHWGDSDEVGTWPELSR